MSKQANTYGVLLGKPDGKGNMEEEGLNGTILK
jgi:hypothetical protein